MLTSLQGDLTATSVTGTLSVTTAAVSGLLIATGSGSNTINAGALTSGEALTLTGGHAATVSALGGNLSASGYTGALNVTASGSAAHTIAAGSGADTIVGGANGNTITGGAGADTMTGGSGADTYVYDAAPESAPGNIDTITNFNTASDKIDLSAVTANPLSFNSSDIGSGTVGHNTIAWHYNSGTNTTIVFVNDHGTGPAESQGSTDMEIHLTGHLTPVSSDFLHH